MGVRCMTEGTQSHIGVLTRRGLGWGVGGTGVQEEGGMHIPNDDSC